MMPQSIPHSITNLLAAEPEAPKVEKTAFDVKLDGFDAAAKIKVIKEIRAVTELGLKEAKELVSPGCGMYLMESADAGQGMPFEYLQG